MPEAVIVNAVRTPIGKRNGRLKDIHPVLLGAAVLKELIARTGIDPSIVGDVVWGTVGQIGEQSANLGRSSWLAAGFPVETPATTVDRQCGSSQQAVHFAANLVELGVCDVTIAGGTESMSRVPLGSNMTSGPGDPFPPELLELYHLVPQGISAELVARKYGITREEMDQFAVRSHQLAKAATEAGHFKREILALEVPVPGNGHTEVMDRDEGIRADTNLAAVAALRPAFDPGHSITAGNSSQITDGSAAVLIMSRKRAESLGLRPRARILAQAVVGCDPVLMLEGPIPSTAAVLDRAGLRIDDIDLFEVNEAFASVPLAWQKVVGADMSKVNVNGGAIALGHPLGASGARLMTTLLHELERRGLRFGLQTMCCGGGIGTATIIDAKPV
jgi:acetyl-CoA acyltransferase